MRGASAAGERRRDRFAEPLAVVAQVVAHVAQMPLVQARAKVARRHVLLQSRAADSRAALLADLRLRVARTDCPADPLSYSECLRQRTTRVGVTGRYVY